jgi:hypothetical protein
MKLAELFEASAEEKKAAIATKAEKQEANKKREKRASPMDAHLNALRDASGLDAKKAALRSMASAFTAGNKENFLKSVENVKTPNDADKLGYNAALKGEGKGSLKNH